MKIIRNILIGFIVCICLVIGIIFYFYSDRLGINIIAPSVEKYVYQAILFMDSQGVYNTDEEWLLVKQEVVEQTKNCTTYEETYPYLEKALKQVGGKHSKLIPYNELNEKLVANYPDMEMIEENIGYIHLPDFSGDTEEMQKYADSVNDFVHEHRDMIGVIIDLQHNTGGDMGPMVAAISSFLPDGEVLSFDNHGVKQSVILEDGTIRGGGSTISVKNSFKLNVPVALLQDEKTASSAEATLLTFRGLEYVKTFGQDSAGYCSCNNTRELYDHSIILLTIGSDVARTGEFFLEDPIQPDVYCDNAKDEAIKWILERE